MNTETEEKKEQRKSVEIPRAQIVRGLIEMLQGSRHHTTRAQLISALTPSNGNLDDWRAGLDIVALDLERIGNALAELMP